MYVLVCMRVCACTCVCVCSRICQRKIEVCEFSQAVKNCAESWPDMMSDLLNQKSNF